MENGTHWINFADSDDFVEVDDGQWHIIATSSDGNSTIIWIDGKEKE